jgi:hypothetical protein
MSRADRRANTAKFRREVSHGLVSSLVDKDDHRLAGEQLMQNAIAHWRRGISIRRHRCFFCSEIFTGESAAAYLLITPIPASTSCGVAGLCEQCWQDTPLADLERAAEKALQPVIGR